MGTWGTAISSNDTFADIYDEFFSMYDEGLEVDEISQKLIATNTDLINDLDDANNFWFALAKAQWECKKLDDKIYERVNLIIQSGSDIDIWRKLDATAKDIEKRKLVLDAFLLKISTEKEKPKARKKRKIYIPAFETGSCLTFKLKNGKYGGVVILNSDLLYGYNLIVVTSINIKNKPSVNVFEKANILIDESNSRPLLYWYHPSRHKLVADKIEVIGKISIDKKYDVSDTNIKASFMSDFDGFIIEKIDTMLDNDVFDKSSTTIKYLTKKSWLEFLKFKL